MTDTQDKSGDGDGGPAGGDRLRAARRARDISIRDIAKELHLDEHKVRALERNEFDVLGAPVFAKGHLRKYAELVGVETDDVMADYYQLTRAVGLPPVLGPVRKPQRDINLGPWIVGIVIAAIVGAALYWWFVAQPGRAGVPAMPAVPATAGDLLPVEDDAAGETTDSADEAATAGAAAVEDAGQTPPDASGQSPAAEPAATSRSPATAVTGGQASDAGSGAVTAVAGQAAGPGDLIVSLSFDADCWTEVTDATGRRLYYDLGRAGRTINLSGRAPFRVVLGDAASASITVDGEPWTIPAAAVTGRLARFSIAPQ